MRGPRTAFPFLPYQILLASYCCLALACAGESPDSDDTETTSPTDGPSPGAPDENCAIDPAKVYILEGRHYAFTTLTQVDDPSVICAFDLPRLWPVVIDPLDGGLMKLSLHDSRIDLVRLGNDWMRRPGESAHWVPEGIGSENDEAVTQLFREPGMPCTGSPDAIFTDDEKVYAHCGGEIYNAPGVEIGNWGAPTFAGFVDGRFVHHTWYHEEGTPLPTQYPPTGVYFASVTNGEESAPIPIPGDINDINHLASRPDGGDLLAAVHVWRDSVRTLEQARVRPSGITLTGQVYAHDLDESGVEGLALFALTADGTLYGLGGLDEPHGLRNIVVRMTLDGAPEVIYESPDDIEGTTALITLGTNAYN